MQLSVKRYGGARRGTQWYQEPEARPSHKIKNHYQFFLFQYLILIPFGYLFGLPQNYDRKVEFSCKFQLSRSNLFVCPKWTTYCVGVDVMAWHFSSVHRDHHHPAVSASARRGRGSCRYAPGTRLCSCIDQPASWFLPWVQGQILQHLRHHYRCLMIQYRRPLPPLRMYPLQNLD